MEAASDPDRNGPLRPPSWRKVVVVWLAAGLAAATCLVKVRDPDVFWHLRAGQLIWETGSIPHSDPFSYTAPGPWTYMEVLAELGFYGAYRALGPAGLELLAFALALGTGWLVARLLRPAERSASALFVTLLLWGMASFFRFGPKTEAFSFASVAALLVLLDGAERSRRPLRWLLPIAPIMLAWANLHRGGVLGMALLVLTGVAWLFDSRRRRQVPALAAVAVSSGLVMLINPAGVDYFVASVDVASRASFTRHLVEWAPPSARFLRTYPAFAVMVLLWLPALVHWQGARRRLRETLVAVALVVLGLLAVRFVPLAAIGMAPGVARTVDRLIQTASQRTKRVVRRSVLVTALGALVLAGAGVNLLAVVAPGDWGFGVLRWRVPVAVADFLRRHPPPGQMWNHFNFGGYFIFALAPQQQVFIDGRNDTVYPEAFFEAAARAAAEPARLIGQADRYDVGFIVTQCIGLRVPDLAPLVQHPQWQLVYMDDVAAVLVRRSIDAAPYLAVHGYQELSPVDGLDRAVAGVVEPARRAQFEHEVARNLAQAPRSLRAHFVAGLLAQRRGDRAAAAHHDEIAEQLVRQRGLL